MADEEDDQQDGIAVTLHMRLRIMRDGTICLNYITDKDLTSEARGQVNRVMEHTRHMETLPVSREQIRYLTGEKQFFTVTGRVAQGDTLFMMSEKRARAEGITDAERRRSFERFQQKTTRYSKPTYEAKLHDVLDVFTESSRGGARHPRKQSDNTYHDLDDARLVEFALRVEEIASADRGNFRQRRPRALEQAAQEYGIPAEYGGKDRPRALRRLADKGRSLIGKGVVRGHSK